MNQSATDDYDDLCTSCFPSFPSSSSSSSSTSSDEENGSIMTVRRTILLIIACMTYCAFFFWCSYYSGTSNQSRRTLAVNDSTQTQVTTTLDKFRGLILSILFPGQELNDMNILTIKHDKEYSSDSVENTEQESLSCSICLDAFELGQVIVISKLCSHYFHRECLLVWLEKKDLCPYCRQPMWIQAQYDDCKAELMAVTNCDDPITSCEELQSNATPEEILPQNQV